MRPRVPWCLERLCGWFCEGREPWDCTVFAGGSLLSCPKPSGEQALWYAVSPETLKCLWDPSSGPRSVGQAAHQSASEQQKLLPHLASKGAGSPP